MHTNGCPAQPVPRLPLNQWRPRLRSTRAPGGPRHTSVPQPLTRIWPPLIPPKRDPRSDRSMWHYHHLCLCRYTPPWWDYRAELAGGRATQPQQVPCRAITTQRLPSVQPNSTKPYVVPWAAVALATLVSSCPPSATAMRTLRHTTPDTVN